MNRAFLVILFHGFLFSSSAQFTVRLEINDLPKEPRRFELFIAGSFNGWNPGNEKFKFRRKENGEYFIDLQLAAGRYEYKITRGSWNEVETKVNGDGIENRILQVTKEESLTINIAGWKDNFPQEKINHSANAQVTIIDTAFVIPQLHRKRRVWIYLPEDYASSKDCYPVLYMHDGQNVFDDATSYAGEWGVDECIDSMKKKCIVVAVDNGLDKRINEYCPYDFSLKSLGLSNTDTMSRGEGGLYVDFLVKTLKPFIDKHYRTLKNRDNTFIAGSSMGGIISMYALLKYPKIFGGAGVFSPAFWVGPAIFDDIKKKGKKVNAKIYFYAGKQESETMVPYTLKAFDGMEAVSPSKMTTVIRDEGKHNEQRWRIEFPLFYEWLMK